MWLPLRAVPVKYAVPPRVANMGSRYVHTSSLCDCHSSCNNKSSSLPNNASMFSVPLNEIREPLINSITISLLFWCLIMDGWKSGSSTFVKGRHSNSLTEPWVGAVTSISWLGYCKALWYITCLFSVVLPDCLPHNTTLRLAGLNRILACQLWGIKTGL